MKVTECEACRIGLVHGNAGRGSSASERAYAEFENAKVNVIIFGHSHAPFLQWRNGILLFNPGSPTDKRRETQYSFGLLKIQENQVNARHLYF